MCLRIQSSPLLAPSIDSQSARSEVHLHQPAVVFLSGMS